MRKLLVLPLVLLLQGCLTVGFIKVEGNKHPHIWVVPGSGISIQREPNDAVGYSELSLGIFRSCQTIGVGVASSSCIVAKPNSRSVEILRGTFRTPAVVKETKHEISDKPIRSAGADS